MTDLFDLPFEEDAARPVAPRDRAPIPAVTPAAGDTVARDARAIESAPALAPARNVYSVAELTTAIRERLESEFFEVWVEGEVSNYRLWNGLAYFTLKDAAAQMRAIMFRSAVRRLRFAIQDGAHLLVRGRVSVYEQRGEYQFICEHVEPRGSGALQLAFEQLKEKLAAEGLFEVSRKRQLPVLPRKIGIVTALEGAALRDIVRIISSRHASVHLVIRAVRVQGEGAAQDVARGLRAIARVPGVDVVIVGRGGGSLEDLWAFNDELVARTIARCPVPVISAVGHEVDWTIADFVADVRAATPSNAAELVVARKDEFCARIARATERLNAAMRHGLQARRARVHASTSRRGLAFVPMRVATRARHVGELQRELQRELRQIVGNNRRRLALVRRRLELCDPVRRLGDLRARCLVADRRLHAAAARRVNRRRGDLAAAAARLDTLSPLGVLGRGYALCWTADGATLIREATPALRDQQVSVTLARGALLCEVRETFVADDGPPLPGPAADRARS
jgi:exodeoxyribonuclease VII large subunit